MENRDEKGRFREGVYQGYTPLGNGKVEGRRFKKGNVPLCPIKKGQRISPSTEFKKGYIPKNKVPVGTVTVRHSRNDSPRAWVKIAEPNTWMPNAVHVWISSGGTIPKGFVIHHENEDSLDDSIENLKLVSRSQHRLLHGKDLREAKYTKTAREFMNNYVPVKNVKCSVCSEVFEGKYQKKKSLCDQCKRRSRAKIASNYRERLRSRSRQKRKPNTT